MPSNLPKRHPSGAQKKRAYISVSKVGQEVGKTSGKINTIRALCDMTNKQTSVKENSSRVSTNAFSNQFEDECNSEKSKTLKSNEVYTLQISHGHDSSAIEETSGLCIQSVTESDITRVTSLELNSQLSFDLFNPISRDVEEMEKHDINMVAEYADEIIEYMRELEVRMMPDSCYINRQPELKWHMRGILFDWLVQVHDRFKMHQETLFLCANYVDRFLSVKEISIDKLQLVGITALFIAAKYEEINPPTISEMIFMADGAFSVDDLKKAERYMMNILNYELGYPDPLNFLRRISKADRYDSSIRTLAKYLLEVTIMYEVFIQYPSSKIAAASYYLAMGLVNKGAWTNSHIHYSGYTERDLISCALQLRSRLPHKQNHEAMFTKYHSERYMNASAYVENIFTDHLQA